MLGRNSLLTRIAIGKAIGMVIGIACFFALPLVMPQPTWQLRVGVLFWYITTGAFIGLCIGFPCSRRLAALDPARRSGCHAFRWNPQYDSPLRCDRFQLANRTFDKQ